MEYYFSISIKCSDDMRKNIEKLIDTFANYDQEASINAANRIGEKVANQVGVIYREYGDYVEMLEWGGKKMLLIKGQSGHGAEEFVVGIMDMLGPHVVAIKGRITHDDDGGDIPMVIEWTN